jgi:cystathionine beta-lyase
MFIADMDFTASPAITERIIGRANHNIYGYTFPERRLFEAFKEWLWEEHHVTVEDEWLELTGGVVPSLAVVSNLITGKSITNTPNYGMLLSAPGKAGNELIRVPLRNTQEKYEIDFEALQEATTPEVGLFYLCNPHNPVGKVYTREELQQLSSYAKKNNLIVVSDEIHSGLVYDREHIPFYSVDEYAREHSITLTSPGKTYNIPGVNLAFAIIPNAELRERFRKANYAFSHPGIFEVQAGIAAYAESGEWHREVVAYLKENRDYLEKELLQRFPKARFPHTEGTYLQWIDFREYGADKDADFFKKYAKIAFSKGDDFGVPGYVRMNFACSRQTLCEALNRIENVLINF